MSSLRLSCRRTHALRFASPRLASPRLASRRASPFTSLLGVALRDRGEAKCSIRAPQNNFSAAPRPRIPPTSHTSFCVTFLGYFIHTCSLLSGWIFLTFFHMCLMSVPPRQSETWFYTSEKLDGFMIFLFVFTLVFYIVS